mmetsp:Transcript_41988/g.101080  ORF Transcript_41988/g.101080 Transcript_41988/m.101080 type:complete len:247 (+) Transcript_41988:110-850(+)
MAAMSGSCLAFHLGPCCFIFHLACFSSSSSCVSACVACFSSCFLAFFSSRLLAHVGFLSFCQTSFSVTYSMSGPHSHCAFGQLWLAQVVLHHRSLAYCPPGLPLSTVLKHCAASSLMPFGTVLSVSTSGTTVAAPSSLMSMGPSRPGTSVSACGRVGTMLSVPRFSASAASRRAASLTSSIVGVSAHLHRSSGQSCVAHRITQYSSVASSRTALQVAGCSDLTRPDWMGTEGAVLPWSPPLLRFLS